MADQIRIDRAVVQQALEFCESVHGGCTDSNDGTVEAITVWCPELIDALRAALAQQAEPVAHVSGDRDAYEGCREDLLHWKRRAQKAEAEREACAIYLKEGETPAQRIERDHRDSLALMRLLASEKRKTEALARQLDATIDRAVNRFLCWKLPQNFYPDGCITFEREKHDAWGGYPVSWPTGTNLLTAEQAREMFEHCLTDAAAPVQKGGGNG